jgi:hypothetical protein
MRFVQLYPRSTRKGTITDKALYAEGIDSILIGAMVALEQGAPLLTVDYDFCVRLLPRQRRLCRLTSRRQRKKSRMSTTCNLSLSRPMAALLFEDALQPQDGKFVSVNAGVRHMPALARSCRVS